MARQPSPHKPVSLVQARRERASLDRMGQDPGWADFGGGQAYVAAEDVVALLNRVGECVRALPSFGRSRTQSSAVRAKRTLSAISTCTPSGLAEDDPLRVVLARLGMTRAALVQADEHGGPDTADDTSSRSRQELIDDLTLVSALIAAEIERLQLMQDERRTA